MAEKTIEKIIDSCLQRWIDRGLNKLPGKIEPEMAGATDKEGCTTWFPVDSKVTDGDILPSDYKRFLKYRHFYELHISEASFTHPVNFWQQKLLKMIYGGFPREFLIDRGYLPFADWCDWGMICFDINVDDGFHNFPVVVWDHEIVNNVTPLSTNFGELIYLLDAEENERILD